MMDEKEKKNLGVDLDGAEALTDVIRKLLNQFPGLDGKTVIFGEPPDNGDFAMYPTGDAAIQEERHSVTGKVRQLCLYPFEVGVKVAGPSETRRAATKEKLDDLGRWLERLREMPAVTGGRRLLAFARKSSAALYKDQESREEFWVVALTAKYEIIFYK